MELVVLIVLAVVVAAVGLDAVLRRRHEPPRPRRDPLITTTQKIIVDLSKRQ